MYEFVFITICAIVTIWNIMAPNIIITLMTCYIGLTCIFLPSGTLKEAYIETWNYWIIIVIVLFFLAFIASLF